MFTQFTTLMGIVGEDIVDGMWERFSIIITKRVTCSVAEQRQLSMPSNMITPLDILTAAFKICRTVNGMSSKFIISMTPNAMAAFDINAQYFRDLSNIETSSIVQGVYSKAGGTIIRWAIVIQLMELVILYAIASRNNPELPPPTFPDSLKQWSIHAGTILIYIDIHVYVYNLFIIIIIIIIF